MEPGNEKAVSTRETSSQAGFNNEGHGAPSYARSQDTQERLRKYRTESEAPRRLDDSDDDHSDNESEDMGLGGLGRGDYSHANEHSPDHGTDEEHDGDDSNNEENGDTGDDDDHEDEDNESDMSESD